MPRYRLQAEACLFLERLYSGRFKTTAVDAPPNDRVFPPFLQCDDEKGHNGRVPSMAFSRNTQSQAVAMPQPCDVCTGKWLLDSSPRIRTVFFLELSQSSTYWAFHGHGKLPWSGPGLEVQYYSSGHEGV